MYAQADDNGLLELEQTDSTNLVLKNALLIGEMHNGAVWARRQMAGVGRMGRRWLSPEGGCYLSVSHCLPQGFSQPILYAVAAGLAVQGMLHEQAQVEADLKWPNDILLNGKKLCGILSELVQVPGGSVHVIAGIGINVNAEVEPTDSLFPPTSLAQQTGLQYDIETLRDALLRELRLQWSLVSESDAKLLLQRWSERSIMPGSWVCIQTHRGEVCGECLGVTDAFELKVKTASGVEQLSEGDCLRVTKRR